MTETGINDPRVKFVNHIGEICMRSPGQYLTFICTVATYLNLADLITIETLFKEAAKMYKDNDKTLLN